MNMVELLKEKRKEKQGIMFKACKKNKYYVVTKEDFDKLKN